MAHKGGKKMFGKSGGGHDGMRTGLMKSPMSKKMPGLSKVPSGKK